MSLHPEAIPPIPETTAKIARRAFRKGNVYIHMRDVLGTFFTDDQFETRQSYLTPVNCLFQGALPPNPPCSTY
jgi:hypothetical protein